MFQKSLAVSIAYCKDCEEVIEGSTETCGACGAELCPYCFNEAGGIPTERDDVEGFFNDKTE